nr:hypothetical protein [Methylosinus sp. R-45379]
MNLQTIAKIKSRVSSLLAGAALSVSLGATSAFAQAAGQTLGSQVQSISKEFSTAGGFAGSTAMYVAALVTFVAGVWFLWQSRQPENRESGKVAAGLTGLVLTGLFVAGGSWIQKASYTTTGAGAKVTDQAGVITFQ